ncbi:MAG: hypothetical protein AAFW89_02715 [Bacteroidota bacterium]
MISFLILLLIASICGGIGQSISGYSFGGCLVSAGVGFIGAILGKWIAAKLELPMFWSIYLDGDPFPVVWAVIGSALFSAVLGFIFNKKKDKN